MGLASYPGGAGALFVPLILLLGWFFSENRIVRILCLGLFAAWFLLMLATGLRDGEPAVLGFPVLAIVLWMILAGIRKSDRQWDR